METHMAVSIIVEIICIALLLVSFLMFMATTKAYHKVPLKEIWTMARVASGGSKGFLLIGSIFFLANAGYPNLLSDWIPPFPRLLEFAVSISILIHVCLPPCILVLGASKESTFNFLSTLAVAPLRVVHLIESFGDNVVPSSVDFPYIQRAEKIKLDEYRVSANWLQAVETFASMAPIIVIDARIPSPGVTEELLHIASTPELHDRTFIITTNSGDVLAGPVNFQMASSHLATEDTLSAAISFFVWSFLFTRSKTTLAQHLEKRLEGPLTVDELHHVQTLRELGMSESILPYGLEEYRQRRANHGRLWPPRF
jgi:hypothetical protein